MTCFNCGGKVEKITTDLPFENSIDSIVIIRKLPVLQCDNCSEFFIEDSVIEEIDNILNGIDKTAELEIFSYAV